MVKLFRFLCFVFFVFLHFALPARGAVASLKQDISLTDSVVKVFVTSNKMDYYRPWQSEGIRPGGGSGAIIKGNRILTNAHVVADHTFIQVKKDSNPKNIRLKYWLLDMIVTLPFFMSMIRAFLTGSRL